jgi:hypothetical protein
VKQTLSDIDVFIWVKKTVCATAAHHRNLLQAGQNGIQVRLQHLKYGAEFGAPAIQMHPLMERFSDFLAGTWICVADQATRMRMTLSRHDLSIVESIAGCLLT